MRRLYGASPLHLLAHLALLPLAGWAVLQVLDQRTATRIVVWLVAAVVVHDFVVLPLYSGADRGVRALTGRAAANVALWLVASVVVVDLLVLPLYSALDWTGRQLFRGAINHVRVPAALSLLMLVVFWGTIGERGEGAYRAASGLEYSGHAERWLLVSGGLFAASALFYLVRRGGSRS